MTSFLIPWMWFTFIVLVWLPLEFTRRRQLSAKIDLQTRVMLAQAEALRATDPWGV